MAGLLRPASQLYKLGARYYNASTGTFTQPDPSGQEANAYTYSGGNPVSRVDPGGLFFINVGGTLNLGIAHLSAGLDLGDGGPHLTVGAGLGPKSSALLSPSLTIHPSGSASSGGDLSTSACVSLACRSQSLIGHGSSTYIDPLDINGGSVGVGYDYTF